MKRAVHTELRKHEPLITDELFRFGKDGKVILIVQTALRFVETGLRIVGALIRHLDSVVTRED